MARKRVKRVKRPFPLKLLLGKASWTQEQLAKSMRMTMTTVNSIANGRVSPRWETIIKITRVLGVDLDGFLATCEPLAGQENRNGR